MTRRELFEAAGFATMGNALAQAQTDSTTRSLSEWAKLPRILIAEAYNPPFYPAFDYKPERAVEISRALNADSMRYPAASYYAYFPTTTRYPIHPELKGDPMKRTVELLREAGLKVVAYVPLNHPFMETNSKNPNFAAWTKRFADGSPMTTEHYGYTKYFEGCLNSPLRGDIVELVREVLVNYKPDVMYFDGPYMGMQNARQYCHCEHCQAAFRKARGKAVPKQDSSLSLVDEIEYTKWMRDDVVIAFLRDIREMIRKTYDVPVLYNDTSLLSRREWRNRAIPVVDGFMFEAAETPEQKLFNLQLGRSTGKTIWTYVGTHTQYNREHMKNERVRGWFSYPVESEELLLDGATAIAGSAGLVYWGLSRFFFMPKPPLAYESGRHVKDVFDFVTRHDKLLRSVAAQPAAGVLVGSQTIDWYKGRQFVAGAYENCYHGAFQLLKDSSIDAEPFLDYRMTPESLAKYRLVYVPNAPCLSDAQCAALKTYVENGGLLLASHLTSIADEYGRVRKDFGLAELFGASYEAAEPVEIPDLYWKVSATGELVPQDPQAMRVKAHPDANVLATTWDVGHRRDLGPAVVMRRPGRGRVIYFGSSVEAIYEETRMTVLRRLFNEHLKPFLDPLRTYRVGYRPGVMPHLTASNDALLLHLLANTGNKTKHLRVREQFVPVENIQVELRIPQGRTPRRVSLLRSGRQLDFEMKDGWLATKLPQLLIHEAIHCEL